MGPSKGGVMRFIPTKTHGFLEYILFTLISLNPWIFGYNYGKTETWLPFFLGVAGILYSMFTDYESAIWRKIHMGTHLTLDFIGGLFLAISPWVFGFSERVWLPFVIFGLLEIGLSVFTHKIPEVCPEGTPCYHQH